jgi:hypothetical protein
MEPITIITSVTLFALICWVRWVGTKGQNDLMKAMREQRKTYNVSLNALGGDFTLYQLRTDREFAELKKDMEMRLKSRDRQIDAANKRMDQMNKSLPSIIGQVVGQIEFSQDTINRKM